VDLASIITRVEGFRADAVEILGQCESSPLRVTSVEDSIRRLNNLTLAQDEMLRQALFCTARGYFRVAVVSSWAAFMDALETLIASDSLLRLHAEYPAWAVHKTIEDLRDNVSEYQIIEAARKLGVIKKGEMKILHGGLAKRNKCAHPSDFGPQFNDTLGFVTEMLDWIERLSSRTAQ
jgi:hypothetical protein